MKNIEVSGSVICKALKKFSLCLLILLSVLNFASCSEAEDKTIDNDSNADKPDNNVSDNNISDNDDSNTDTYGIFTFGDYEYTIYDNEVSLSYYTGNAETVVIPSYIKGYPVTRISAFYENDKMKRVIIPNTVKTIWNECFASCSNLEEVYIPESVEDIEPNIFYNCGSLKKIEVDKNNKNFCNINGGLYKYTVSNGEAEIVGYTGTAETLVIPSQINGFPVTTIGGFCYDCSIKSVTIPDSVKRVSSCTFFHCNYLEEIYIPASVEDMEPSQFFKCPSLKKIVVDEDNKNFCDVDGVMYSKDMTVLWEYPAAREEETFVVPKTVTEIRFFAFVPKVKKIVVGENVKISENVMYYIEELIVSP